VAWLFKETAGATAMVKLTPVRHDQDRVVIRVFHKLANQPPHKLGEVVFRPEPGGFIDLPELEAVLRIDATGRLYVQISGVGKPVHARFRFPTVTKSAKTALANWVKPVTIGLLGLGTIATVAALIILVLRTQA
jgi:hypothetical protein